MTLGNLLENLSGPIERVEIFALRTNVERHFSHGVWRGRVHAVLRLEAGGHCGWGECMAQANTENFDLASWGARLETLQNLPWREVAAKLQAARDVWPVKQLEMAEMAVLDLAGRLRGQSVGQMLGLEGRESVPGLFCILESDPHRAAERARFALQNNLKTHAKVKIFGQSELDCAVVAAVRSEMGPHAFLCADANDGYQSRGAELVRDLRKLRAAGLDACEDPAKLAREAWVELQSAVGDLDLIPDAPLRPAWKAREKVVPGMGRIYNIHPGTAGSLVEAVALARRVQSFGARLMVGDDSLVGPACTAWQQMAIGLRAAWCESLEKADECDGFLRCVRVQSTKQNSDGRFDLRERRPGFGLDVDDSRLRENCAQILAF